MVRVGEYVWCRASEYDASRQLEGVSVIYITSDNKEELSRYGEARLTVYGDYEVVVWKS